jgi:hypothetical protein
MTPFARPLLLGPKTARDASALCRRPALAGWLYTAAQFAANDALRSEHRRIRREHEAHLIGPNPEESAGGRKRGHGLTFDKIPGPGDLISKLAMGFDSRVGPNCQKSTHDPFFRP